MSPLESRPAAPDPDPRDRLAAAVAGLMATLGYYLAADDGAIAGSSVSRWASNASDGGARRAFWIAVALSVAAVVSLVAGARSGRLSVAIGGVTVGGLAVAATAIAFVAFGAGS